MFFSLQTKLGEKVNILLDRLVEYWGGDGQNDKKGKGKGAAQKPGNAQTHQPSQADYLDTQYDDATTGRCINEQPTS